jgi:RND family efflux transporter MFP subunit
MTALRRLAVIAGLAILAAACGAPEPPAAEPVRAARIEAARPAQAAAVRVFVGRVEARLTVDLAFQVGGRLASFPVSEGEILDEGAVVAALETQDFDRALREARVQLQQARQNLDRVQTLHERGIAADAALEDARTAYDLRAVSLDNAQQNLEYATVSAPFEGLVSRRLVDNFTTVAAGQPVARLQDVSELRVAIQVPESVLALVDEREPAELSARFPFLPDQSFTLEFRELVAEPDRASQTYTVLFALPNDIPANILPGMTANVRVIIEPSAQVAEAGGAIIPVTALSPASEGGFVVWVFDPASSVVNARRISVGPVTGEMVRVEEGLAPGEQIVTAGVNALYEGMAVRPLQGGAEASVVLNGPGRF